MKRVMAALTLLASASPLSAQQNYGRPIDTAENRAWMALRFSSRCAVSEVPASARKVLDTVIGSADEAKRVKSLVGLARKCYPGQWPAFPSTLVRGAIAESFYIEAYRTNAPTMVAKSAPPVSFGVVPAGTTGTSEQEVSWTLAAVANCIVYADAAGVRHLLLGPANVDEEIRRFDALRPSIGKCVPPAQATVLKPVTFRGYLADALFRQARGM